MRAMRRWRGCLALLRWGRTAFRGLPCWRAPGLRPGLCAQGPSRVAQALCHHAGLRIEMNPVEGVRRGRRNLFLNTTPPQLHWVEDRYVLEFGSLSLSLLLYQRGEASLSLSAERSERAGTGDRARLGGRVRLVAVVHTKRRRRPAVAPAPVVGVAQRRGRGVGRRAGRQVRRRGVAKLQGVVGLVAAVADAHGRRGRLAVGACERERQLSEGAAGALGSRGALLCCPAALGAPVPSSRSGGGAWPPPPLPSFSCSGWRVSPPSWPLGLAALAVPVPFLEREHAIVGPPGWREATSSASPALHHASGCKWLPHVKPAADSHRTLEKREDWLHGDLWTTQLQQQQTKEPPSSRLVLFPPVHEHCACCRPASLQAVAGGGGAVDLRRSGATTALQIYPSRYKEVEFGTS